MIVCPLHHYYSPEHLADVTATMQVLGSPVLRGHYHDGVVYLAEGTHRIRAAHALGLTPIVRRIPWWRDRAALDRAFFAACRHGLDFKHVVLQPAP